VDHEGRFYRLRIAALDDLASAPGRDIPIYTAGVNPRMIEAAGRVADGLLGHTLFSPRYIAEVVRPALERGAAHARRDPGDVALATYTLASAHEDREQLRRFDGVVDEVVLSPPTFRVAPERVAENLATLVEHCAPQRSFTGTAAC
jgi:alkanesulfonate monooxygenase SsuD/methylene tetrahydromethanopterin reductase-like flavin-dependent oxidoreductase (luciferase family)